MVSIWTSCDFKCGHQMVSNADTIWFLHGYHIVSMLTPCGVQETTWKPAQETALHEVNWLPCCSWSYWPLRLLYSMLPFKCYINNALIILWTFATYMKLTFCEFCWKLVKVTTYFKQNQLLVSNFWFFLLTAKKVRSHSYIWKPQNSLYARTALNPVGGMATFHNK